MNSRFDRERRQPPYYLLTGLILGLILGSIVSFFVFPVQYNNVPPETLNLVDKDQYRLMIAQAYQAAPDIGRAQARLGLLREANMIQVLQEQVKRSENRSDAQVLQNLAFALRDPALPEMSTAIPILTEIPPTTTSTPTFPPRVDTATVVSPLSTNTPQPNQPTFTPLPPTATSALTGNIPFVLAEKKEICNPGLSEPLIQVEVFDDDQNPLSNMQVNVSWDSGQDSFYTGYFPEISLGYADFMMTEGVSYNVRIGDIGENVTNLLAPKCEDDAGNQYWGSIYLRFEEP